MFTSIATFTKKRACRGVYYICEGYMYYNMFTHCSLVTSYDDINLGYFGLGNGTNLLPETMLTYHQRYSVAFTEVFINLIHGMYSEITL